MMNVRKALSQDAEAILEVQNQGWLDTYESILGRDQVMAINQKRTVQEWSNIIASTTTRTFVIENKAAKVVGFSGCGSNREEMSGLPGEIYAIYVLKDYHRGGYGKALFQQAIAYLESHHLTPFVVWAFKDNPACRFYERMGGQFIKDGPSRTEPTIIENCYGFYNV